MRPAVRADGVDGDRAVGGGDDESLALDGDPWPGGAPDLPADALALEHLELLATRIVVHAPGRGVRAADEVVHLLDGASPVDHLPTSALPHQPSYVASASSCGIRGARPARTRSTLSTIASDAEGEELVEVEAAERVVGPMSTVPPQSTGPVSNPSSGQKTVRPFSGVAVMTAQLIALGAAVAAARATGDTGSCRAGRVQDGLGHEPRDEGHDHQIGAQCGELARHLRRPRTTPPGGPRCPRRGPLVPGGRVVARRVVRRAVDRDDVLAVLAQSLEHLGPERLLSVDDDPHLITRPRALVARSDSDGRSCQSYRNSRKATVRAPPRSSLRREWAAGLPGQDLHVPVGSGTRIRCPSRISRVASSTPTTAGSPYSWAITAPWVISPPTSVTRPAIATNSGVQLGSV